MYFTTELTSINVEQNLIWKSPEMLDINEIFQAFFRAWPPLLLIV